MIDFIVDVTQYEFLQNALIASLLASLICAITGTYIVSRRLVFLSGGITHASFGGIGLAYFMGFNPILGALIFSVVSALGLDYISYQKNVREDSAIGVLWAIGMAVGIIFIFLTPGYTPNLMSFLFGSILTITPDILYGNAILAALLLIVITFFNRPIIYSAFDRDFAATQNMPVRLISSIMMALVAASIVMVIKLVGVMLLVSLIAIPPIIANLITTSYNKIMVISLALTAIGLVSGLYISYATNLPPGASSVIVLGTLFVIVKIVIIALNSLSLKRDSSC